MPFRCHGPNMPEFGRNHNGRWLSRVFIDGTVSDRNR
jgi:hypothetical protein